MIITEITADFICENHWDNDVCHKPKQINGESLVDCINVIKEMGWKVTESHKVYCPYCIKKMKATVKKG